jgi:hypothetical protein
MIASPRLQHLAQPGRPSPAATLGRRQQGPDQRELLVRHVGGVATARASMLMRAEAVHIGRDPWFLAEQGRHDLLIPLTFLSDELSIRM